MIWACGLNLTLHISFTTGLPSFPKLGAQAGPAAGDGEGAGLGPTVLGPTPALTHLPPEKQLRPSHARGPATVLPTPGLCRPCPLPPLWLPDTPLPFTALLQHDPSRDPSQQSP